MRPARRVSGGAARTGCGSSGRTVGHASPLLILGGCLLAAWPLAARPADDYVSTLESEVDKVEARVIDPEKGDAVVEPARRPLEAPAPVISADRAAFEALLKKRYFGTYGFYRKLPERSREEIFEDYRQGADIGEIRRKIVSRLLQH
ncbi:MAG TPA: hypothetical protein ENJ94_04720 [Gammaproteobacteria bacterium]|nr:hypothetical protein [Gammaproteobacteria bacterium]